MSNPHLVRQWLASGGLTRNCVCRFCAAIRADGIPIIRRRAYLLSVHITPVCSYECRGGICLAFTRNHGDLAIRAESQAIATPQAQNTPIPPLTLETSLEGLLSSAYSAAAVASLEDADHRLLVIAGDIGEYQGFLVDLYTKRSRLRRAKEAVRPENRALIPWARERAVADAEGLQGLVAAGEIVSADVLPGKILAIETLPITLTHDSVEYSLGAYSIRIFVFQSKGWVEIRSLANDKREYPHPHINRLNIPCYGAIAVSVAQLLGELRLTELVALLLAYLSSYNHSDPYLPITRFDTYSLENGYDCCRDCGDKNSPFCIVECPAGGHGRGFVCWDLNSDCCAECHYEDDCQQCDD